MSSQEYHHQVRVSGVGRGEAPPCQELAVWGEVPHCAAQHR